MGFVKKSRYVYKCTCKETCVCTFTKSTYVRIYVIIHTQLYLALISLFSCIFQVFIRELERLETNFFSSESTSTPSPHQQHAMLIATLKNTTTTNTNNNNNSNHKYNNDNNRIVAFVDIDRRSDNFAEQIPLPYLSDLIVSQQFRNQVCLYILVIFTSEELLHCM